MADPKPGLASLWNITWWPPKWNLFHKTVQQLMLEVSQWRWWRSGVLCMITVIIVVLSWWPTQDFHSSRVSWSLGDGTLVGSSPNRDLTTVRYCTSLYRTWAEPRPPSHLTCVPRSQTACWARVLVFDRGYRHHANQQPWRVGNLIIRDDQFRMSCVKRLLSWGPVH